MRISEFLSPDAVIADLRAGDKQEVLRELSATLAHAHPPLKEERLVEVLRSHPGANELHVHVRTRTGRTVVRAGDQLRIDRTSSLYGDLKALLGPNCLV